MNRLFGLLHLFITFFMSFYGFTKKNALDTFYIIYVLIVFLSWTFFDGECILSIFYDKWNNIQTSAARANDMLVWFGNNVNYYNIFMIITSLVTIFSIWTVFKRNDIPSIVIISLLLLFIIYISLIKIYKNYKNNIRFIVVQFINKVYCLFLLFYCFFVLKLK